VQHVKFAIEMLDSYPCLVFILKYFLILLVLS